MKYIENENDSEFPFWEYGKNTNIIDKRRWLIQINALMHYLDLKK